MSGLLRKSFMPWGTSRTLYLTVILSHNDSFVPRWHYIYHFCSEIKYTWIVHFIWPIICLSTLYDRFEFKILVTICSIKRYFISKIPSTVILTRFQYNITYRDLFIFHHFRYLNFCQGFMKCYVLVLLLKHLPHYHDHFDHLLLSFLREFYIWNRLVYHASGVP